jgi:hypothetical protein
MPVEDLFCVPNGQSVVRLKLASKKTGIPDHVLGFLAC